MNPSDTSSSYTLTTNSTPLTDLSSSWQAGVDSALKQIKEEDSRFVQAEIKGRPHTSTYEPEEKKDVVSVRLKDEGGRRIATAHIRKNGTHTKR
ncbi:hypothetical protein FRC18_002239 [Serendipita sp. 400]|nr:hypothetical protein FRC18_002239 [Serendipita sp. 400]